MVGNNKIKAPKFTGLATTELMSDFNNLEEAMDHFRLYEMLERPC